MSEIVKIVDQLLHAGYNWEELAEIRRLAQELEGVLTGEQQWRGALEEAIKHAGASVAETDHWSGPFPLVLIWTGTIQPVTPNGVAPK